MDEYTIDLAAMLASLETVVYHARRHDGRARDIAKKPNVTDVDSWPGTQHSSWYITWMAIVTTLIYAISKPCV
jgi:hypothetical protein